MQPKTAHPKEVLMSSEGGVAIGAADPTIMGVMSVEDRFADSALLISAHERLL